MKKLGLIGGVGVESTIPYYKGIVYGVQKRVGKPFFPNLTIESLSTFEVIRITQNGNLQELGDYFYTGLQTLIKSGAQVAAMACNTGHLVFDNLQKRPIPLISIVEQTCKSIQTSGFHRVGLMGMKATMEGSLYQLPLQSKGIEVLLPNSQEREIIHAIIAQELELGIIKRESLGKFLKIIERMQKEQGIEAMILACTELPLLFEDTKACVPLLNTMDLHIKACVEAILKD